MYLRWQRARGADDGIALVMAIALVGMVGVLLVTLVGLAIRENRATGNNRDRAASVTTAEGAVDATLAAVQQTGVASLPCGSTTTSSQSVPDVISITTSVTYLNAGGTALACPPDEVTVASQILIKATATSTPAGGGQAVRRSFETLAALKPTYSTDLNKAIFGNAGISVGNNFDLYGQSGPDADVYTNGNFSCTNNEHFRGSIVAPLGSITLSNTCLIDVNAYAKTGFTMSSGTVAGDVKVSAGSASITGGTVGGKVYASNSSTWCTANPSKCTVGAVKIPSVSTFPVLNGDAATIATYTAAGYATVTRTNCSSSSSASPGYWLVNVAPTITQPTVLQTPCRLDFANNAKTVALNNNVAVFADRGISVSNSIGFQSTVSAVPHQILFIHPADFATRVPETCASLGTGISLSQLVNMTSDVSEMLYSPCDIIKANQSTIYGQVYSGGVATISNKTDAYYEPVDVLGVSTTKVVEYYQADVLYQRETI
ncbi:MAG: hypothetical protein JWM02_2624 [Frankiales bacterium]|nr:hypothetical protein [Frankiales bacterium]